MARLSPFYGSFEVSINDTFNISYPVISGLQRHATRYHRVNYRHFLDVERLWKIQSQDVISLLAE